MSQQAERIIIGAAIGLLGAMAVGIKLVEGINSYLRWQLKGEPIEPTIDTSTNGGAKAGRQWARSG